jgi:hypothetical protein
VAKSAAAKTAGGAHPLLVALIAELPARGGDFGRAEREAWLRMMATGFDVVYGPLGVATALPSIGELQAAAGAPVERGAGQVAPAAPAASKHAGHAFFIAHDGTVCDASGAAVQIGDVPEDETIFDYRPVTGDFRDLDSIVWADGATGRHGIAAGVSFCGPG